MTWISPMRTRVTRAVDPWCVQQEFSSWSTLWVSQCGHKSNTSNLWPLWFVETSNENCAHFSAVNQLRSLKFWISLRRTHLTRTERQQFLMLRLAASARYVNGPSRLSFLCVLDDETGRNGQVEENLASRHIMKPKRLKMYTILYNSYLYNPVFDSDVRAIKSWCFFMHVPPPKTLPSPDRSCSRTAYCCLHSSFAWRSLGKQERHAAPSYQVV